MPVPVAGGLLTVELDFGPNAFTRQVRWLVVAVRPGNNTGAYTPLTPRQRVAPAPPALYAVTAGSARTAATTTTATTADTATTAKSAPWSGLTGVPAGFADGLDNDTVYTVGAGRLLNAGQFSVSFGGGGAANTTARSDHLHDGVYAARSHAHDAGDITSGTLAEGRLSVNVPLLNRAQSFTAAQSFQSGAAATPVVVQGAAGQSANLQEWRDSTGALVTSPAKTAACAVPTFTASSSSRRTHSFSPGSGKRPRCQ